MSIVCQPKHQIVRLPLHRGYSVVGGELWGRENSTLVIVTLVVVRRPNLL